MQRFVSHNKVECLVKLSCSAMDVKPVLFNVRFNKNLPFLVMNAKHSINLFV